MIEINGVQVKYQKGQTILDAAKLAGIDIPTLCHDERVKDYAACGLCVVEVEGMKNLVRACATEAVQGMKVTTDNERVRRSRQLTLELILSDHCGDCRPPCTLACPAGTDCQGYVGLIANHHFEAAVVLLKETHPLPLSLGLICTRPCEKACRRQFVEEPVAIAELKAFAASQDIYRDHPYRPLLKEASGKRVALIGSGPASLTAAYFLARAGHQAVIYEAMPQPGGMLRYGIPEYRLPKDLLDREIELIEQLGVKIITGTSIPADIDLPTLRKEYDAVFVGIGAWQSTQIGCPGENHGAVIGGIDFLRQVSMQEPPSIGTRVAVIGGGNTAMDAARTAVRLGATQVMVLYRRTQAEMPAEDMEIAEAKEEGVIFKFLLAPEEITGSEAGLQGIKMQKMKLGQADASGRRRPEPTGETEFIEVDTIIAAIGQQVNPAGFEETGLSRWQSLEVDEATMQTVLPGIFAGGDAVTGPGTAIEAIAQGQKAASAIDDYLRKQSRPKAFSYLAQREVRAEDFKDYPAQPRIYPKMTDVQVRCQDFRPVKGFFTVEEAQAEAKRCLECGCLDYFECRLLQYAREYQVKPERWQGIKRDHIPLEMHTFMSRDMNKCILCGLCVRVCDEVMGISALGFISRGFDTQVAPELGLHWEDTACISCGQCVALCPTGALVEQNNWGKNIPLPLQGTPTTCPACDWGCQAVVKAYQGMVAKVEPARDGLLCIQGRFAWQQDDSNRIMAPRMKQNGEWHELSLEAALRTFSSFRQELLAQPGFTGVFISPAHTLEEAEAAASMAKALQADYLSSFTARSTVGLEHLSVTANGGNLDLRLRQAELIFMIGSFEHNHIPAVKACQAARAGSRLIVLSEQASLADEVAERICGQDEGLGEIQTLCTGVQRVLVLVDGYQCDPRTMQVVAELFRLNASGRPPLYDIMMVSPGGNARGIWQAGFRQPYYELEDIFAGGEMKTLLIAGEDPVGCGLLAPEVLEQVKLLLVVASSDNETTRLAHIVLPAATPFESSGTYVSLDGALRRLEQAQSPPFDKDNRAIFRAITASI